MNTLNDKMMKTCEILRGIDEEKAKCLKMFINCKPLVEWLRETMPCKFTIISQTMINNFYALVTRRRGHECLPIP